jgi:hypothetical protein
MESNGLGKLFPKAMATKRRRKKESPSVAETTSSTDDIAPERGRSTLSRQTTDSLKDALPEGEEHEEDAGLGASYASDAES